MLQGVISWCINNAHKEEKRIRHDVLYEPQENHD